MPTYSLWLCCAEPERSRLQDVVSALAARHGLPSFPVHLTLVPQYGGALPELQAACAALQRATPALRVPLASATAGHDPAHWRFRCVYLPAAAPPPPPLLAARAAAEAALGFSEAAFLPHLSLAYSECDAAAREALAAEARELLGAPVVLLDSLQVWDTTAPDPAAWHLKESYALSAMQ